MDHPIAIVGAGLGGLSAAIHLAANGRRVVLLEQNEHVGGKLDVVEAGGFRFDTGPSLLTMPWVLRLVFEAAGARLEDELRLIPLDPLCRYTWPDGARFDAWQSLPRLLPEVARLAPADVAGFLRFMAYSARLYEAAAGPFLLSPFASLRAMLRPAAVAGALAIDPFRTVDRAVRSFFCSPHLRQLFNRYATYNGSSPYRAPATFNLIPYVEWSQGGWHVCGGMYEVARALERVARRLGVEIRTGTPVDRIIVRGGAARGVRLAGGEELECTAVVANVDPRTVYGRLIPQAAAELRRLERLELSYSGFVLLLGVEGRYPQLAHHNVFFTADDRREFDAIVGRRVPYADPTVYVCAPSVTDPLLAPPGATNLFVLVNAPALSARVRWAREAGPYRDLVIRRLERMGLEGLGRRIVVERVITPADIAARYAAPGGAIYGLASNGPLAAFLRPPQRARRIRGLYFAGGGTHPGGGIPLVLLSGRSAAHHLLASGGAASHARVAQNEDHHLLASGGAG
ncbi:MAG TPA: phytoene desaturase family protein [Roseiflexaceae bacterium]|nr:phytoene desaturase family protein [Roseiflexaceae bacterium]